MSARDIAAARGLPMSPVSQLAWQALADLHAETGYAPEIPAIQP